VANDRVRWTWRVAVRMVVLSSEDGMKLFETRSAAVPVAAVRRKSKAWEVLIVSVVSRLLRLGQSRSGLRFVGVA
jgi:hypothetical protein